MKPSNKWLSLAIILVAPLLTIVDVYITNLALPAIRAQYKTADSNIELIISAYLVGYCVFLVTGGRSGDFWGRKRLFLIGMAAFTVTSALCGWAETVYQLIFFRFLQGIAAAIMVPQTLTIMQVTYRTPHDRNMAFGLLGVAMGIASVIGQFLGGYFLGQTQFMAESWRLIFLINIPIGGLTLLAAFIFLNDSKLGNAGKFDMGGVGLLTVALSALIYSLTVIPEQGLSALVLGLLTCSSLFFYIFWKNQHQKTLNKANPLLNTDLFQIKSFNFVLLIVLFYFGAHNTFLLISAIQYQQKLGLTPIEASHSYVFNGIGFLLSSFIALRLLKKHGVKLLIVGCILMIISVIGQIMTLSDKTNIYLISYWLFLYGLGQGTVLPSILNYALRKIPPQYAALAGGVYSTVQQFSSALGLSIIGSVYFYSLHHGLNAYTVGMGFVATYLILVVFLLYRLSKFSNAHEVVKPVVGEN